MGYIYHPNLLSSLVLGFSPHQVVSNSRCVLHLWTSYDASAEQHHFFVLIAIKKAFSCHIVYASVVSFVLAIDPR